MAGLLFSKTVRVEAQLLEEVNGSVLLSVVVSSLKVSTLVQYIVIVVTLCICQSSFSLLHYRSHSLEPPDLK